MPVNHEKELLEAIKKPDQAKITQLLDDTKIKWDWEKVKDEDDCTALMWAVKNKLLDVVQKLVEYGVSINAADKNGDTALHIAAAKDQFEFVALLIGKKAKTWCENKEGKTAREVAEVGSKSFHIITTKGNEYAEKIITNLNINYAELVTARFVQPIAYAENYVAQVYRLLTSLLYKVHRHSWDDNLLKKARNCIYMIAGITQLRALHDDPIRRELREIIAIIDSGASDIEKRNKLSAKLAEFENEHGDFYGSYLSDDSDSDEEKKFLEELLVQQGERLHIAKNLREKSDYSSLFVKSRPTNPLKPKLSDKLKISRNVKPIKSEEEWKKIEQNRLLINQRLKDGMSIEQAIQGVDTEFVVAQIRGIHYRASEYDQSARKTHRQLDERDRPLFSASVYAAAGAYPFFNYYQETAEVRAQKAPVLLEKAKILKANLIAARKTEPVVYIYNNSKYIYNSLGHMLQDIYTKDYKRFHAMIEKEKFGVLLNDKNPNVSTGNIGSHALLYAYGIKYYDQSRNSEESKEKAERLRPRWNKDGRAERPYSGKTYLTLHPLTDYDKEGPLNVISMNQNGEAEILNNVLFEAERSFPSYIDGDRVVEQHVAKYPSFKGEHKKIFEYKYGLDVNLYNKFKQKILAAKPHSEEAKEIKRLLGLWLCTYHEVRLLEIAKQKAKEVGKVLIYLKQDGTLDWEPDDNKEIGMMSGEKNAKSREEIEQKRSFRKFLAGVVGIDERFFRHVTREEAQQVLSKFLDQIFLTQTSSTEKNPVFDIDESDLEFADASENESEGPNFEH